MIRTHQLTRTFGDTIAVNRLSLEVPRGQFFCFLGPNGAGKTTTIKLLTGLLRPTSGSAEIGGYDIQRQPLEAKRLLGYIPDRPFLYERLTVLELMRLVAALHDMAIATLEDEISAVLDRFGILELGSRLIGDLSHGMRQKVAFAATFLTRPSIVVIDEPWVGLDPRSIRLVKRFLRDQTRDGVTIFMSTHTLGIAEELADRVGIIHRGVLISVGSVPEMARLASRPGTLEDVFLELTGDGT